VGAWALTGARRGGKGPSPHVLRLLTGRLHSQSQGPHPRPMSVAASPVALLASMAVADHGGDMGGGRRLSQKKLYQGLGGGMCWQPSSVSFLKALAKSAKKRFSSLV
jgi:hypothetical protein